jgi:hypothetical protein
MHGVISQMPVSCHLLPELVFAPRLTFAKTASELYLHYDNPAVRRQNHIRFGRIIVSGTSLPEQHFYRFPIHPIQFKATYPPFIEMFHVSQEVTQVRLPRQVIQNAEEIASEDVLAILPAVKLG